MKKAVVLGPDLRARGGAERVAVTMASQLNALGYDTVLAFPGENLDLSVIGAYFDVDLSGVRGMPLEHRERGAFGREELRILSEQIRWKAALKRLDPDVFVNCMTSSEMPALAPRSLYYVHFPHRLEVPGAGGLRRLYVAGSRALRAVATNRGRPFLTGYAVVANSAFTARHVAARWGHTPGVLHPPTSSPAAPPSGQPRERWILAVGRFQERIPGHPHKRQDAMIDAFKKLVDGDAAGWQLHLAGSVGSPEELKRLEASATGYPIVFHPDASWQELRGLYEQASLFWHAQGFEEDLDQRPEAQEHFGITVVEALGAGLIPLVYDAAGPAEIVGSLPSASTWRTQEELVSLTRAKLALSELDAAHERAVAITRATDFADQAFREHLTTLIEGGAAR